jgi:exopolyphosphatase/guanosine-5'-triphosphate,3'-diphosphate pyrophosphatase
MQRIAIVDFGSNTAKMVALAYEPGRSFRLLDELRAVVRLSEGLERDGALQPAAFERGLATIRTFASYAHAAGIREIVASATSAVRDASNGAVFAAAAAAAGVPLQVLSGREEARIGALAVANSFALQDALTLDLGGGSLQLSELRQRAWLAGESWPLGAVRAQERFLRGDPPRLKGIVALRAAVREALRPWRGRATDHALIAVGGTVRNLASAHQRRIGYPLEVLHGYTLSAAILQGLTEELLGMTRSQRAELGGISRDRADVIAAGAAVIAEVVSVLGAETLQVSGEGLREGLFYPHLMPATPGHLIPDLRSFSVRNLMHQYHDQPAHNEHVQRLALTLFDALQPFHRWGAGERELLGHAALIHDIGMAVDYERHDHHGLALVVGRALPGFAHREQALLALQVRYHRKGTPSLGPYAPLMRARDEERLALLAGILRLAEYLDRGRAQRVRRLSVHAEGDRLVVEVAGAAGLGLEIEAAGGRRELLAAALGRELEVRAASGGGSAGHDPTPTDGA